MSPTFRSTDALRPEHVGRRVTIRRRLPDGAASDVLGILEAVGEVAKVRTRTGELVEVPFGDIVAARLVRPASRPPARPGG